MDTRDDGDKKTQKVKSRSDKPKSKVDTAPQSEGSFTSEFEPNTEQKKDDFLTDFPEKPREKPHETLREDFSEKYNEQFRQSAALLNAKNPDLVAQIYMRMAVRVLPCIALEGHFDFWVDSHESESTKKSASTKSQAPVNSRAKHLLAVYYALRFSELKDWKYKSLSQLAAALAASDAASLASGSASSSSSALATAAVASASAFVYSSSSYSDSFLASVSRTAVAVLDTVEAAGYGANFMAATLKDFTVVNNGMTADELSARALWSDSAPVEWINLYNDKFKPAVLKLIDETLEPDTREALRSIVVFYDTLIADADVSPAFSKETAAIEEDKLNRAPLINALSDLLRAKDNSGPLTVGLLGHWGSGKSAFLHLLKKSLKEKTVSKDNQSQSNERYLFGEFNAWAYEHSKNIQAAMAHEVITSLTCCQDYIAPTSDTLAAGRSNHKKANIFAVLLSKTPRLLRLITVSANGVIGIWWALCRIVISVRFSLRKHPWQVSILIFWLASIIIIPWLAWEYKKDILDFSENGVFAVGLGILGSVLFGVVQTFSNVRKLFSQAFTKELLTYVKLPSYVSHIGEVSQMREDIAHMCDLRLGSQEADKPFHLGRRRPKKRLLFVVDDLDRCGPEGIVKTFEAVRLILDIPQVVVIIAIDQRIALAALALHYQKLEKFHALNDAKAIARDYLGKMLQLPIVLQELDDNAMTGYLADIWQDKTPEQQAWMRELRDSTIAESDSVDDEADINEVAELDDSLDGNEKTVTNGEDLSEQNLVRLVKKLPVTDRTVDEIIGLSDDQKMAFSAWAIKFKLNNARQLRRLHNSYNLLCLVKRSPDIKIETSDDFDATPAFRWMLSLFVLEYINNEDNTQRRAAMRKFAFDGCETEALSADSKKLLAGAVELLQSQSSDDVSNGALEKDFMTQEVSSILSDIEMYVLPAIETDVLPVIETDVESDIGKHQK
ncbi:MAG: hypothetical protein ACI93R_001645 [Flavobacteriales bacterium]|jgi:hypothetical protein